MMIDGLTLQIILSAISSGLDQISRGKIRRGIRTIREAQNLLRQKAVRS